MQPVLIWDVPTRLFHWTLAASFVGAWLSSESDQWLSIHVFLGYLMLGLVGFRVVWGLSGTHYARFASFWYGPKEAFRYARQVLAGSAARHLGHNPAGSLAIYLLLLLTLIVGVSGFFTLGGEEQHGLASVWFGINQGRAFKKLHEFSSNLMLVLVLVHITGVVVESLLHRENLARAMLSGRKLNDTPTPAARPHWLVAGVLLAAMMTFAGWWFFYALHEPVENQLGRGESTPESPEVAFVGAKLADNAQWREECGSCHLAFHPSLLPARSWQRIMAEQDRHFGADLGLDAATSAALLAFLSQNSADRQKTEPAVKILRSIPPAAVPLRITDTPYWVNKHRDIQPEAWSVPQVKTKSNCAACHLDAQAGTFEDAATQIPRRSP